MESYFDVSEFGSALTELASTLVGLLDDPNIISEDFDVQRRELLSVLARRLFAVGRLDKTPEPLMCVQVAMVDSLLLGMFKSKACRNTYIRAVEDRCSPAVLNLVSSPEETVCE